MEWATASNEAIFPVRIDGQKAETAEVDVHQEGIADIGLAVVAEDDDVRLVQRALAAQAFQNSAELLIVHAQLRLGLPAFHAVGVPGRSRGRTT